MRVPGLSSHMVSGKKVMFGEHVDKNTKMQYIEFIEANAKYDTLWWRKRPDTIKYACWN